MLQGLVLLAAGFANAAEVVMDLLGIGVEIQGLEQHGLGFVELAAAEENDALALLGTLVIGLGGEHFRDERIRGVQVALGQVDLGKVEDDLAVGGVLLSGLLEFVGGRVELALFAE